MRQFRILLFITAIVLHIALPVHAQRGVTATHVVMPGETLGVIAQRYGINLFDLAALNSINNAHLIYTWQELQLPSISAPAVSTSEVRGTHIVQRGETLDTIAKSYGIDLLELQTLNGIFNAWIYPGDELALPIPGRIPAPAATAEPVTIDPAPPVLEGETHIVQFGETLGTIATSYGVSLSELQSLNDIWTWLIYPGDQLVIPAGVTRTPAITTADIPAPVAQSPAPAVLPNTHIVQRGETLFGIAQQYDVSVDALMAANAITDPRRIHSGLTLRVRDLETYIPPAAPSGPAPVSAPAPATAASRKQYVVQPGEFLSQIGAKFGMNWLAIADINGISNPDTVYVGSVLQIPTADEAAKYGPVNATNYGNFHASNSHPGPKVGVGRELVVVLSTQTAYAYENGVLQKRALISSGLTATPTVQGDFTVLRKLATRHMVGPDYDLPNVPWVMYFYQGYAFHGTYWHNNFGTPMSHGCVNMTTADAKWFYDFAPIGTPVHVRFY